MKSYEIILNASGLIGLESDLNGDYINNWPGCSVND